MQHKPLDGIRILEIGGYIALPFATSILCALGAEVVKVEKPVVGEDFRRHQNDGSPYFRQYNTGKRSLSIDLKHPEGIALVKALVPHFDVVLENLRPGKLAALGLGPDECRALRSDLVYGSVTGFGSGGPLASRPAYDTIGHAFGGLYSLFGDDARPAGRRAQCGPDHRTEYGHRRPRGARRTAAHRRAATHGDVDHGGRQRSGD